MSFLGQAVAKFNQSADGGDPEVFLARARHFLHMDQDGAEGEDGVKVEDDSASTNAEESQQGSSTGGRKKRSTRKRSKRVGA